jgi:DNA-binding CsgD family transcriptional regulator
MRRTIQTFFSGNRSSVCVLTPGREVHYQNRACLSLCGDYRGGNCPQACAYSCGADPAKPLCGEGMRFFPNARIGGNQFDALFVNHGSRRMVVLHPLERKHERLLVRFRTKGLSPREMEVVELGLKGFTNERIGRELGISPSTLKTHLNNIYRKFPEARSENWRGKG